MEHFVEFAANCKTPYCALILAVAGDSDGNYVNITIGTVSAGTE